MPCVFPLLMFYLFIIGGPNQFILIVATAAGGGGLIVVVLGAVTGLSIYFWKRRKCRQHPEYDRLIDNHHPTESVVHRHPPTIVGSPLIHTEDVEREHGGQRGKP